MTACTLALAPAFCLPAVGACAESETAHSLHCARIPCLAQDASGAARLGLGDGLTVMQPD